MMTNMRQKIQFKKNLPSYLIELKKLTGIDVNSESLSSVEDVESIRKKASALGSAKTTKFVMDFEEKNSERFKNFIENLFRSNNGPIYLWTSRSNLCGLYKLDSIRMVDFSFPFDLNPEGIVVFLAEDTSNKLLLDFSVDSQGQEILEVELQGKNWPLVKY
jgi:hypothetical protein